MEGYKENHKGTANVCKQAQENFWDFWLNVNLKELSRHAQTKIKSQWKSNCRNGTGLDIQWV